MRKTRDIDIPSIVPSHNHSTTSKPHLHYIEPDVLQKHQPRDSFVPLCIWVRDHRRAPLASLMQWEIRLLGLRSISVNRVKRSSNKCLSSSNKKLLGTSASLLVTSALLVVTIRI